MVLISFAKNGMYDMKPIKSINPAKDRKGKQRNVTMSRTLTFLKNGFNIISVTMY